MNARKRPVKRFDVGCRVSGSFNDYCPNPNPNIPRRVRARIFGNIIEAVGHLQYRVLWDDGVSCEPDFSNSTDSFGNLRSRQVERPAAISDFFRDSNIVDSHNQARQHDLGLEETWVTTDCYFRLVTTLMGLSVTDAWKLADYHGIINFGKQEDNRMSIRRFAGIVGNQLVRRACSIASKTGQRFASDLTQEGIVTAASSFYLSSTVLSSLSSGPEQQIVIPMRSLTDANGDAHHQVLFPLTQSSNGKKYRKTRPCKLCHENDVKKLVGFYCYTCGLSAAYCCPSTFKMEGTVS